MANNQPNTAFEFLEGSTNKSIEKEQKIIEKEQNISEELNGIEHTQKKINDRLKDI